MNQIDSQFSKDDSIAFKLKRARRNRWTFICLLALVSLIFVIGFLHIREELAVNRNAVSITNP